MVVTVGGGGTISGIWRGFKDLEALGKIDALPRLVGVVPNDYNALKIAFERGLASWNEVLTLPFHDLPPSILVKLAHAYPPDGMDALEAVRESGGFFAAVSDEQALSALVRVGRRDGLYVEASTSACMPVIDEMIGEGTVKTDETLVALMCGSGFRETFVTRDRIPLGKDTVTMDELATSLARMG
jgi:threonine synthase